jgi:tripartite-type tricarboxylate transporter receptor subunit TctC
MKGRIAGPFVCRPAHAASTNAAEFYRGKTVRILVGSPPGGGYDIYARLVAPSLAADQPYLFMKAPDASANQDFPPKR